MKKAACLFFAACILLLTGCKDSKIQPDSSEPPPSPTQAVTETVPPSSNAPAQTGDVPAAVEPTPSSASTASPNGSQRPEKSSITIYSDGIEKIIETELVYQNLSETPFVAFSMYSDTESFSLKHEGDAFRFYKGEGDSAPFIEIRFIPGKDSGELKPAFADEYIFYTEIFWSQAVVGEEDMFSTAITAYNDERYAEIYLIDVYGGTTAIIISFPSENAGSDASEMLAMLSTLIIYEQNF